MITQYGMSERFGLMGLESVESRYLDGRPVLNCADATAAQIDEEVKELLKECYRKALEHLRENRDVLDELAKFLVERETITGKEFMDIYRRVKGLPEETEKTEEDGENSKETTNSENTDELPRSDAAIHSSGVEDADRPDEGGTVV